MSNRALTAEEKVCRGTHQLVETRRRAGHVHAAIRATITRAITTALEGGEHLGGTDGNGVQAESLTSSAARFRIVFELEGVDRADQRVIADSNHENLAG